MKHKFIMFLLVGILGSGMYVSATSILPNDEETVQTRTNDLSNKNLQTNWNKWNHYGMSDQMNNYYLSQEDHQAIMVKRVELTKELFGDYKSMTTKELINADATYHTMIKEFVDLRLQEEQTNVYYDHNYMREHYNLDEEVYADVIIKRVELVNQYLSNYNELTMDERRDQERLYHDAMHDYMYTFMNDVFSDGGFGRNGSGPCHGGSRYYEYRNDDRYSNQQDETYYNSDNNTYHRRGNRMAW